MPLLNQVTVYADEETEEKDNQDEREENLTGADNDVNLNANVFAFGNEGFSRNILADASYDPSMHYLITYAVLKSDLTEIGNQSAYAKVYKGQHMGAYSGEIGSAVGKKLGIPETNFENYLDSVGGVNTTLEFGTAADAPSDNVGETKPTLSQEQLDALRKDLAKDITDVLFPIIRQNLASPIPLDKVEQRTGKDIHTRAINYLNPVYKVRIPVAYISLDSVLGGGMYKETEDKLRNALYEEVINHLDGVNNNQVLPEKIEDMKPFLVEVEKRAYNKIDNSNQVVYHNEPNIDYFSEHEILGSVTKEGEVFLHMKHLVTGSFDPNEFGDISDKDLSVIAKNNHDVMLSLHYNLLSKSEKETFKKKIKGYVSEIKKKPSYRKYMQETDNIESATKTPGFNLMAWTVITPIVDTQKAPSDIFDSLDKNRLGGKLNPAGHIEDEETKDARILRTGDFFLTGQDFLVTLKGSQNLFGTSSASHTNSGVHLYLGDQSSSTSENKNIPRYIGAHLPSSLFSTKNNGILDFLVNNVVDIKPPSQEQYDANLKNVEGGVTGPMVLMSALTASPSKLGNAGNTYANSLEHSVGIDNYGNLISGSEGSILMPYWQMDWFDINGKNDMTEVMFGASPIAKYDYAVTMTKNALKGFTTKESTMEEANLTAMVGNNKVVKEKIDKVVAAFPTELNLSQVKQTLMSGVDGVDQDEMIRALAIIITMDTKDDIKAFNAKMLKEAEKAQRLYMLTGNDTAESNNTAQNKEEFRWTAASLIQRIGYFWDYGFYDVLRLTSSRTAASFYNNTFANTNLSPVFYTDTIVGENKDPFTLILLASFIMLVATVYVIYQAFLLWRGHGSVLQITKQVILLAFIIVIPGAIYGPLTNLILNVPSQIVLDNQLKTSAILDTYLLLDNSEKSTNIYYQNMFGRSNDSDNLRLDSYLMRFYTTTDKKGFNINEVNPDSPDLTFLERQRVKNYRYKGKEYPKGHLIAVDVPIIDLYKWTWDTLNGGESVEERREENVELRRTEQVEDQGDENTASSFQETGGSVNYFAQTCTIDPTRPPLPTYDEAMEKPNGTPLFEWLAKGGGTYQKVEGYSPDLAGYEEYKANLVTELAQYYPEVRKSLDEAVGADESLLVQLRGDNNNPYDISASELFYTIIKNSSEGLVPCNFGELHKLSMMIRGETMDTSNNTLFWYPQPEYVKSLVRDLSLTRKRRVEYYGDDLYSPFSRVVIDGVPRPLEISKLIEMDGGKGSEKNKKLPIALNIKMPQNDFLNLMGILNDVMPPSARKYLDENAHKENIFNIFRNRTIDGDIYDINYDFIMSYLNNYSQTRASMGPSRNQDLLAHSEQMVMATEAFFQFNKTLQIEQFPQGYRSGSISFDKYLSLIYVPFSKYGTATLNFHDSTPVVPRSTAEAIVLESNMIAQGLFIFAVVGVSILGLSYWAMFYVVLLVLIIIVYVKNYLLRPNPDNKMMIGILGIYLTWGLVKLGLVSIWSVLSRVLNESVANSSTNEPFSWYVLGFSAILIVYCIGSFIVLVGNVRAIAQDFDNLGGEVFANGISKLAGKMRVTGTVSTKGKRGSAASRLKNNVGPNARSGLKRSPNLKGINARRFLRNAGKVGATAGLAATGEAVSKAKKAVNDKIHEKNQTNRRGGYKDLMNIKDEKVKLNKGTAKNKVDRMNLTRQVGKANAINATVKGLSEKVLEGAKLGATLTNEADTMITSMKVGSALAAATIAKNLASKGIKAVSKGDQVFFDSTGYDLTDNAVRAELFRGGVNELQDQFLENTTSYKDHAVKKKDAANNFSVENQGNRVRVKIGSDGIHGENAKNLFKSREFRQLFLPVNLKDPALLNANGELDGFVDLNLKNPQVDKGKVNQVMNNLYKKDARLRKQKGFNDRESIDFNKYIEFSNLTDKDRVYVEDLAHSTGMLVQKNRLYYKSNRRSHANAISSLKKDFNQQMSESKDNYLNPSRDVLSYITKNGNNQGIYNKTGTLEEMGVGAAAIYGANHIRKGLQRVKVENGMEEDIVKRRDALGKVQKLFQQTQTQDDIRSYQKAKERIVQSGIEALTTRSEEGLRDTREYNNTVENYIEKTHDLSQLKESKAFQGIKKQRENLEDLYHKQRISPEEYYNAQEQLTTSYKELLKDNGVLDRFSLDVAKKHNKDAHNEYHNRLQKVERISGLGRKSLQELRASDMTKQTMLAIDPEALKVENGVASVSFREGETPRSSQYLQNDTSKYILGTHKDDNYVQKETEDLIYKHKPTSKESIKKALGIEDDQMRKKFIDKDLYEKTQRKNKESILDKGAQAFDLTKWFDTLSKQINQAKDKETLLRLKKDIERKYSLKLITKEYYEEIISLVNVKMKRI